MSEPRQGIYLDATLSLIESRVDAEIDRMTRRTRRRIVALVTCLIVATVGFGSAAAAFTVPRIWPVSSTPGVSEFNCVEGDYVGNYPYFGVRFTVTDAPAGYGVDPERICRYVWSTLEVTTDRSVDSRLAAGDRMQSTAIAILENEAKLLKLDGVPTFDISQLQWGPVDRVSYGKVAPAMAVCERTADGSLWVISADPGKTLNAATDCARNHGFTVWTARDK